jgi:uncharacterized protein (TIGR00255 family)
MAIASMTGFARESGATGTFQWAWELKTVNGRALDVRPRVPPGFDALGETARQAILKNLSRGSCQLNLTVNRAASAPRVRVNEAVLGALLDAVGRLKAPDGVRPASLDGLLAVRGVVEVEEADDEIGREVLETDLGQAIGRLVEAVRAARRVEGEVLGRVIEGQLAAIERLVQAAEEHPGRRPEAIRSRLAAQVAQLLDGASVLDPDRLHQEAVLLAARADIREELDRLHAHLASARELLSADGPVGRRLDFLAQELGRESNTLCAKANDVALSRIGLDLKGVVEQFREQVQNVE